MPLHNKIDKRILKERISESTEKRVTLSFYKYHHISDPTEFRNDLYKTWESLGVFGRIYIAKEGINGQLSVPENSFEEFKTHLYTYDFLNGIRLNIAVENDDKSFFKLIVKVRKKIVADGLDDDAFDVTDTGTHLDAESFNEITSDPNTILVDMRNHYESEVGHFKGAILPDADNFREELPIVEKIVKGKEDKNLVMYCTGGIRCEKASAYFKSRGFSNVYQLEGGIIKYAQDVKEKGLENKFRGKNFVFDDRLGERISDEIVSNCHQCGKPSDVHINCRNDACHLLFIQCDECREKYSGCCSERCKETNSLSPDKQKDLRKGKKYGRQVFKKSRFDKLESGSLQNLRLKLD